MNQLRLLSYLNPARALKAIRQRGARGAALHALRRTGTLRERAMVGPQMLRITPMGFVCNHTCPMCWLQHLPAEELNAEKKKDLTGALTLAEYEQLFDSMPPGLEEVNVVGGGEPLIHKECVEIMQAIKRRGWAGSIITNGTLMREAVSRAMIAMRWDITRVSIHAADAATYQKIQGVDRFDTLNENLRTFVRLRREAGVAPEQCRMIFFHVVQRDNLDSLGALFTHAESIGADYIEFDPMIPLSPEFDLTAAEFRRAREALEAAARDSRVPCNIGEILPQLRKEEITVAAGQPFRPAHKCSVGFDQAMLTATGEVRPCCFSDEVMGNVREQSFRDIWFGEAYARFRAQLIRGRFRKYCISNRCSLPGVLHDR